MPTKIIVIHELTKNIGPADMSFIACIVPTSFQHRSDVTGTIELTLVPSQTYCNSTSRMLMARRKPGERYLRRGEDRPSERQRIGDRTSAFRLPTTLETSL
jgi:hypothetical protein